MTVDKTKTSAFYLTQNKILDDCSCDDCSFFATSIINRPFEIFKLLSQMGVDLSKNLSTEPTGVWCVRDKSAEVIHCEQVYRIYGQIKSGTGQIKYKSIDQNLDIEAIFNQVDNDFIEVALLIDQSTNKTTA